MMTVLNKNTSKHITFIIFSFLLTKSYKIYLLLFINRQIENKRLRENRAISVVTLVKL